MKITPNFSWSEFLCPGTRIDTDAYGVTAIYDDKDNAYADAYFNIQLLANRLQVLRDLYGPIQINSGFRTPEYNKSIGGAKHSWHIAGCAADIVISDWENYYSSKGWKWTNAFFPEWDGRWSGGLGVYDTFIHLDIRPEKARWDNRTYTKTIKV